MWCLFPTKALQAGAYVSVLAGVGRSFKIRSTHRSIDDTLISRNSLDDYIVRLSRKNLAFYCKSRVYLNNLYFETDCTHVETD